jgi:hypothetical protein
MPASWPENPLNPYNVPRYGTSRRTSLSLLAKVTATSQSDIGYIVIVTKAHPNAKYLD